MKTVWTWLRGTPFSVAVFAVSVAVAIVLHSAWEPLSREQTGSWGFQTTDLFDGQWWSFLTTMFVSSNPAALALSSIVILGVLGLAESTIGTWRTACFFVVSQLGGVLLFSAVVGIGSAANLEWLRDMAHASLVGPYAAAAGALMAASRVISVLWRRRVRSLTITIALMLTLYVGHAQNIFILCAALTGLILGMIFLPALNPTLATRSTSREVRTNLAILVAVFAVGPFMAAVAHVPVGPLARLRNLIVNPVPSEGDLHNGCNTVEFACQTLLHNQGFMVPGSRLLSLVPMLLLLACAEGLRRGNRMALWIAVYLHLIIGVVSGIYLQVFEGFGISLRRGHRVLNVDSSLIEVLPVVLVPFIIAGLLVLFRRHFSIDPDPVLRRRAFALLPLVLGIFVATYSLVWFLEGNASGRLGWVGLLASLPRVLLPYPFPFAYGEAVYPHGFFSTLLFSLGGGLLWLFSVLSVLLLFLSRGTRGVAASEKGRAEALVRQGGDSLSWMALWPGNSYWFNSAGTAGIAYQAHAGVAVTVGGPIGRADDFDAAAVEFLEFCAEESLIPCFYSVNDDQWDVLSLRGFRRAQVASETLLDIESMEFKGKEWQNVRTALNKASKLKITTHWGRYSDLPTGLKTQIHEISEEWVTGKALPEMGFTLGGIEELKDDAVTLCLAIDDTGKVHGVTSWLPVFKDGQEVSATLDFMRRNTDAFNGVMEYLIAQAVLHFKGRFATISLSGSPLSSDPESHHSAHDSSVDSTLEEESAVPEVVSVHPLAALEDSSMDRILGLLARTLEPVYGFASLANFKRRFQPRHRTLYMMYQDPLALPSIGRAVGEAYMPNVSVRALAKLLRKPEEKADEKVVVKTVAGQAVQAQESSGQESGVKVAKTTSAKNDSQQTTEQQTTEQ